MEINKQLSDIPFIQLKNLENNRDLALPRRLMRYVLIWCSKGALTLVVDENEYELLENQIITITSGQAHFVKASSAAKGFVLEFTFNFFCKDDTDIELVFHNGLFCHFALNEVITICDSATIDNLWTKIDDELTHKPYQYLITVHACLELILVTINRAKIDRGDEIWKPDALFLKFLELVRANFRQHYPVSRLAEMLQTTELKLNDLSKQFTGKTAQNVVYGLMVSEAKRLLTYEKWSVKEIAHELGFNDPFYFSNFFKKHTGVSPKSYKEATAII